MRTQPLALLLKWLRPHFPENPRISHTLQTACQHKSGEKTHFLPFKAQEKQKADELFHRPFPLPKTPTCLMLLSTR
jgi:hypothetical protein